MNNRKHALIVLSGGQDSATCLVWALKIYEKVTTITFTYGQRHQAETTAAKFIAANYSVPLHVVNLPRLNVSSALLDAGDINAQHEHNAKLPASYVPGRNAIFLTMAHALAQEIKADAIVTGICETDYSGYPDCRHNFIIQLEDALNEGYLTNIAIETPLMKLNKAQIFALAESLYALPMVLSLTLTCYENDYMKINEWGRGCGKCPACKLRKKGFEEFKRKENKC